MKTFSQILGIQVSMDTENTARSTYQRIRITRSNSGARTVAMEGGVGGSTAANGSFAPPRVRIPGTRTSAPTSTTNGREVRAADDQMLPAGRYPCRTVTVIPIRIPTSTAMGSDRRTAQAAAANAATIRSA